MYQQQAAGMSTFAFLQNGPLSGPSVLLLHHLTAYFENRPMNGQCHNPCSVILLSADLDAQVA